jgi:hypothetical protein
MKSEDILEAQGKTECQCGKAQVTLAAAAAET